ncbi:MAG: hypothetical protein A2W90_12795 [Bacteroidetes bacterium GWF2_42_66]|nr:MAG: hypothetical protein A2W92_22635 [Bacteroidetes bacterium GWA2_42_15]OFY00100.1 MAG: hypothetical protein A2W89_17780 [Bacteroidetes bacterium GWE2_42_39]OFY40243.1 MAG: hypothetical protein A2W90_12795 [Bacteroidetes bacterium GWF2_42_66]HBL74080.1 hypothetical protein [Prolixibacteraceae bacterium]HCR90674.1 hypothetical protein [Prolixibacteraceae bacterium]
MKRIIVFFSLLLVFSVVSGYSKNQTDKSSVIVMNANNDDASAVKAYYFHATRRCATCQAVEAVTKEALKEYYGDQVSFQSINREEDSKNPLIEKYKISGQTLLIIKGDKVINLTNEAFLNARIKPDKFKAKLKSTIDSIK